MNAFWGGTAAYQSRNTITGYEVPIKWPYVEGRLYGRTLHGLACFDLRKPPQTPTNRTLHMRIPARMVGRHSDMHVTLSQRDGELTHGGFRGASRLHRVRVDGLDWEGEHLAGTMEIAADGYRKFAEYHVDATANEDGWLSGTVSRRVEALDESVPMSGKVLAVEHQPAWMPPATHVLHLDDAAIQEDGNRGQLLLFLTVEDGRIKQVGGFAPRTTQAPPVIDGSGLELSGGRLTGKIEVRYRPDKWAEPLSKAGGTAAAVYTLQADLTGSDEVGS